MVRDEQILRSLVFRVKMLSLEQVAGYWWKDAVRPTAFATRRLDQLCRAKLLDRRRVMAHPMLELAAPVSTWTPGEPDPTPEEYEAVSYRLQARWEAGGPPEPTVVYLAHRRAVAQLGGAGGKLPPVGQETHDLHVSALYMRLIGRGYAAGSRWLGEEILRPTRKQEKLPDAVLVDDDGKPNLIIEFGGRYKPERVRAFHEDARERQMRYELW